MFLLFGNIRLKYEVLPKNRKELETVCHITSLYLSVPCRLDNELVQLYHWWYTQQSEICKVNLLLNVINECLSAGAPSPDGRLLGQGDPEAPSIKELVQAIGLIETHGHPIRFKRYLQYCEVVRYAQTAGKLCCF